MEFGDDTNMIERSNKIKNVDNPPRVICILGLNEAAVEGSEAW
jgi:hypothetical protein